MTALLDQAMSELENHDAGGRKKADRDEALAFLRWLRDNNFTFLGMREYTYSGKGDDAVVERGKGRGLGILSNPDVRVLRQGKDAVLTTPEILAFLNGPDFLIVTKANVKSVVHRRAYMDYIGVKRFDAKRQCHRRTAHRRPLHLDRLYAAGRRNSAAALQGREDRRSFRLRSAEPFRQDAGPIRWNPIRATTSSRSMSACWRASANRSTNWPTGRASAFCRASTISIVSSPLSSMCRASSMIPIVREKIGNYLKTVYDGRVSAYYPAFPEGGAGARAFHHRPLRAARHRVFRRPSSKRRSATSSPAGSTASTCSPRHDGVEISVSAGLSGGLHAGRGLCRPRRYRRLPPSDPIRIAFYPKRGKGPISLELKIFHAGEPVSLSHRVPLLENLGFRVISEQTIDISRHRQGRASGLVVLHDMELIHRDGHVLNLDKTGPMLEEAYLAAWNGTDRGRQLQPADPARPA